MSESQQNRKPRTSEMLISNFTIAGSILGIIVLLVGLFNIHTDGIVPGFVDSIVLILAWTIAGILIGLMVFRRFRGKSSSRTVMIVVSSFSGILGGAIVVGAIALCIAVWYFETHCC